MNKEKVLKYLKSRIDALEKEDLYNRSLNDNIVNKNMFIEGTSRELRAFKEIAAFIESGLAD